MRFEIGKQVVCFYNGGWDYGFGPKYGDILTVEKYGYFRSGPFGERLTNHFWLAFEEWRDVRDGNRVGYAAKWFRPLVDISELTEILEQQPATV